MSQGIYSDIFMNLNLKVLKSQNYVPMNVLTLDWSFEYLK